MTEAPRGAVESGVLGPLLAPDADLTRKRVTLLYRPHRASAAARIADADVRTALGRATSRTGEAKATETVELTVARQAARDEAAGAGLTRFSLLVTATVEDRGELAHVADVAAKAGGASRVTLRRVAGGQSAVFAACSVSASSSPPTSPRAPYATTSNPHRSPRMVTIHPHRPGLERGC